MTVNVGVIGLGFIGQTHARAVAELRALGVDVRLSAVCDRSPDRVTGRVTPPLAIDAAPGAALFDPADVTVHTDARRLIDDPHVDLVVIATPTDTHVDLAAAALKAGKHVLCEKPIALDSTDVRQLAETAYRTQRLCMPAMCMRFWPGWTDLKAAVDTQRLGPVRSAAFERLGCPPSWNTPFYTDIARSGGTLFDLHVHDADIIFWLFGRPEEVVCVGTPAHVTTIYRFDTSRGGPTHVVAHAGQDFTPPFPFRMTFAVAFERGSMAFDSRRIGDESPGLRVYAETAQAGSPPSESTTPESPWAAQMRHLVESITRGLRNDELTATIDDAVAVTRILEAERESLDRQRPVPVA